MSRSNPYSQYGYKAAPEPMQRAMSQLLHFVTVCCRNNATDETFTRKELHDMMDAVHNIPDWMFRWDERMQPDELRSFLAGYESRWPDGLKLTAMFDRFYWEASHPFWDEPTVHQTDVVELLTTDTRKSPFTLTYWVVDGQVVGQTTNSSGELRVCSARADSLEDLKQQVIASHSRRPIIGD